MSVEVLFINSSFNEIIEFFSKVLENIKNELNAGITWEKIILIPGQEEQINLIQKGINEDLNIYKEEILKKQNEKIDIINKRKKQLIVYEEKFIIQSKEKTKNFKKIFKKFSKDLSEGKLTNIKTIYEASNNVGLEKLKNDLLEIEIYEKEQLNLFIKEFRQEIKKIDDIMQNQTNILKEKLDIKKNRLKEKMEQLISEIKNKIDIYNENDKSERDKGESKNHKDEKMKELIDLFNMGEFNSDKDKIFEILDERISKLKDSLDNERIISTESYFNNLINNEYYRNKTKIEDINAIYSMYIGIIKEEIYNNQSFY